MRYSFDKWNADGTLLEIHDMLRRAVRVKQGRAPEPSAIVLASQSVKTAEAGGERGFDSGKQVKGRKRQFVVATHGNLVAVAVHAANINDGVGSETVLTETNEVCPTLTHAWARVSWSVGGMGTAAIGQCPGDCHAFGRPNWLRCSATPLGCRTNDCLGQPVPTFEQGRRTFGQNSVAWIYWASIQRMVRLLAPPADQERPYSRKNAFPTT